MKFRSATDTYILLFHRHHFPIEPFREPVDWQALGLFDYPQLIKKPMDLGLVKKKLKENKYKSIHDAADDFRLIWKNCMAYNADGSDFYNLAQVRDQRFVVYVFPR